MVYVIITKSIRLQTAIGEKDKMEVFAKTRVDLTLSIRNKLNLRVSLSITRQFVESRFIR